MKENVRIAIENIEWANEHMHETLYNFRHLMLDLEFTNQEVDTIKKWLADNPINVEVVFSLVGVGFDKPTKWTMYIFLRDDNGF